MFYLLILASLFIGFALGRLGHIYFGHLRSPHHWIYGAALMVTGIFLYQYSWDSYLIAFGFGLFISDFIDFLHLRFYGVDHDKHKTFWNID